jgi:predicted outer membrane repeat protein
MSRHSWITVCTLLVLPSAVFATIRYVPSGYTSVQSAIVASSNGDTVLVDHNTYLENIDFLGKRIVVASLLLTTGDTSHISQTVLNGGGSSVNKSVVTFQGGEDTLSVLRGFTITNGYASGSHGGGVTIANGSRPRIEDCRIIGNSGAAGYTAGVGIYCAASSPKVTRCVITYNRIPNNGNNDQRGGGIYIGSSSSPVFDSCSITNNMPGAGWGRNYGGGIYCSGSSPVFHNCTISDNEADFGGGIYALSSSTVSAWNCVFDRNSTSTHGGGVASYSTSVVQLDSCFVTRNYAGGNGGGLYMEGNGRVNATRSTITDNTAALGAGVYAASGTTPTLTNCIIWYNWFNEITPSTLTQVTYCDIRGGYQGTGNLDIDPLFCDWLTRQFTLASNSACLTGGSAGSRMGYFPSGCSAITPKTRKVPPDYTTIQDAIFHSYQGDTILVATGTRAENPVFWGRRVLLTSQYTLSGDTSHIGQTVLNGGGSTANQSVVSLIEAEDSLCVLKGFTITNGYASGSHGGGVTIANGFRPRIEDCRIIGNSGPAGTMAGIGVFCASSSPRISRCVISNNSAPINGNDDHDGGGVYIGSSSSPIFRGCSINNNSIAFGVNYRNYGGGVYCSSSSPLFDSCSFGNNTADRGGGIYLTGSSNAKLFYCLVVNNQSRALGGGLYSENSTPTSVNNTFFKNTAVSDGGALYCTNSTTTLMNTICWRDTATGVQEITSSGGSITVAYSDILGGWTGLGNINADPLFEDEAFLRLSANSPCVDAGNPDPGYNDRADPAHPDSALYPARGGLRDDMGAYGGSGLTVFIPLGVGDRPNASASLPLMFDLGQNYPNPFNPTTAVSYQLPAVSDVRLVVYDLLGREVAVLVNEKKAPGRYEVGFDASGLSSGVYLYRLSAGSFVQTRKMVMVK